MEKEAFRDPSPFEKVPCRICPGATHSRLNFFVYACAELDGKPFAALKQEFSFRDDIAGDAITAGIR